MLHRFWRNIGWLAGAVSALFSRLRLRRAVRPRGFWDSRLVLTLNNLLQQNAAGGRVQVLTLAKFRESIGDLWPRYAAKVAIIVESTTGRMIGKGNVFIAQGEDTWLLLFPGLSEAEAEARTEAIAMKIGEKLAGRQFAEHEPPFPVSARLDLSGAFSADGFLNMEAVQLAVEKARLAQGTAPKEVPPPPAAARAALGPALTFQPRSLAGQFEILYRPAWSADTQSIDTYFFRAFTDSGVNLFSARAPLLNAPTALDLVRVATAAFRDLCARKVRAKFVLPLQFASLDGTTAGEIQRLIALLDAQNRLLQLRVELTRVPLNLPIDRLVAVRELFRPYARDVAFLTESLSLDDPVFTLEHIALGIDVGTMTNLGDDEFFHSMHAFRQLAGDRTTYILGIRSRAHLSRAISAGIKEVDGTALADDVKHLPDHITILRRDEILS